MNHSTCQIEQFVIKDAYSYSKYLYTEELPCYGILKWAMIAIGYNSGRSDGDGTVDDITLHRLQIYVKRYPHFPFLQIGRVCDVDRNATSGLRRSRAGS